jgi:pimeloyl-ACP methyl ester carboxylesterase
MFTFRRPAAAAVAGLAALTALAVGPAPPRAAAASVVSHGVSFQVHSTNTSMVPCPTDGAAYTIQGHLTAPAGQLDPGGAHAVVLDLHGLGYGEFFWHFQSVPGYDWAAGLAARGIASVSVDRLGYGASSHPPGTQTCMGGQADIAHQMVQALRTGSYSMDGGPGVGFPKVVVAGHSAGGGISQVEAYSFHDVDGLMIFSWADSDQSPQVLGAFAQTGGVCLTGGKPPGYAPLGQSDDEFKALMFHSADPAVEAAATAMRSPDPCGDDGSIPAEIFVDHLQVQSIKLPVLLVMGANDAIFPPPSLDHQKSLYTGTGDLTAVSVPDTGHAVTLELSASSTRDTVASWLCARGFCSG